MASMSDPESDCGAGPSDAKNIKIEIKSESIKEESFLYDSLSEEEYCSNSDDYLDEFEEDYDSDGDTKQGIMDTTLEDTEEWHDNADTMLKFPFTKENRLLVPIPPTGKPIDYFRLLADEHFLNLIVEQTNEYATELFCSEGVSERSRISKWKDLTLPELLIFIGLILHMGTIQIPRLQDYWKNHRLFNFTCFSNYLSRDRFLSILRCLHFCKNPEAGQAKPNDPLYKIRPVLDMFRKKMSDIYYPGKTLILGETMVLWRGRLINRQYIKDRRYKNAMKLYNVCEPDGTILDISTYSGVAVSGLTNDLIMLLNPKLNNGHSVYTEDAFTSYELAEKLLLRNTYCTGLLQSDAKIIPSGITTANLMKGQTKCQYKNGVMIGKFIDLKSVFYISTEFSNKIHSYQSRWGHMKGKPLPIINYNKNISCLDRKDQVMSYYPYSRKSTKWYKKLGIHVLQVMLFNAFRLYRKFSGGNLTFYHFRLAVLEALLPVEKHVETAKTMVTEHFLTKINRTSAKRKTLRKRCRVCTRNHKRSDTIFHCEMCPENPGLCIGECFRQYHSDK